MKPALEKEFGQLEDRIVLDQEERGVRVISIEYWKVSGWKLDDNWRPRTVKALRQANISSKEVGNSVRADRQNIADTVANSFQIVVVPKDIEGEALATKNVNYVMALTISVLEKKVKKY